MICKGQDRRWLVFRLRNAELYTDPSHQLDHSRSYTIRGQKRGGLFLIQEPTIDESRSSREEIYKKNASDRTRKTSGHSQVEFKAMAQVLSNRAVF